ncbi:MAG: rhomboid family intramembrane serine protease [Flavobacteriales bacterium]|nr:rhomboid family intramembrane serine protease [Flavobacteriales bacterium]
MGLQDDLRTQWRSGGMVVRLILINVAVFVVLHLVDLPFWLANAQPPDVLRWLKSTSDVYTLLYTPWTVITYMFTHWDLMHIFFNMLVLWFAGRMFEDLLGGRRMLGNYLLGGISGFALYMISYNFFPVFARFSEGSTILGASAAVMGVFIGIAAYRPEMEVQLLLFGRIKLKWIALIYVFIDLISIRQGGNSGGHIAHLGGALYGYMASVQLRKGNDWSLGFVDLLDKLRSPFVRNKGPRMRVEKRFVRSTVTKDAEFNAGKREKQARVDAILDKISRAGYDSLSKEEKDFLFKASNGNP